MKLPTPAACVTSSPMFARASPSSNAEPEVRQLERDVDLQLLGRDAVEDLPVRLDDDARLGLVVDALAEQRRVGLEAVVVEPPQHDDRVVERLARDEPGCAEAHPVAPHAALQPRAVGGGEDRLPQGGLDAGEGRHLGSGLYATATKWPVPNGRGAREEGVSRRESPFVPESVTNFPQGLPGEADRGARTRARSAVRAPWPAEDRRTAPVGWRYPASAAGRGCRRRASRTPRSARERSC